MSPPDSKAGAEQQEDVAAEDLHPLKKAKYTCSNKGNIHAGWEEKGILRFNEIAGMIGNQRKDKDGNDNLDDALITHWKGMKKDTCSRKPEKVTATRAYRENTAI